MTIRPVWIIAAAAVFAVAASAQEDEENSGPTQSRAMKTAIMFYEQGDDMQAMDRFMDILVKGDPSERASANEYLNLITHRMNSGNKDFKRPAPPPPTQVEAVKPEPARRATARVPEPDSVSREPASAPAPARPAARLEAAALPPANRELMKKEIRSKLRYLLDASLKELKATEGVRVLMLEDGDPQAVAIPSGLLFSSSGITFTQPAGRLLDSLTRLVYSLGSTQVVILPEGAGAGDAKVLDMRRSMGVSAHFFAAGIATPRVRVNLLNSQVDIPKPLQAFKGLVLLFVYNKPLELVVDTSLGEEAGPPISLGVYPQAFRTDEGEGTVIEFSVADPPAGLASWKFQLLQPAAEGSELAPLQEVAGGGPVFHQIYWNGRQNYFGPVLPPARYECVLSATDGKNRTRTLHRWVQLAGTTAVVKKAPAPAPAPAVASAPPPAAPKAAEPNPAKALPEAETLEQKAPPAAQGVQIRKPVLAAKPRKKPQRKSRSAPSRPKPSPKPEAEPQAKPAEAQDTPPTEAAAAPGLSVVSFKSGTYQMTAQGEKSLAKVAQSLSDGPSRSVDLLGFAGSAEPDATKLSQRRAQLIAGLLINKYQIEPKRIQVHSSVSDGGAEKVEVRIASTAAKEAQP